MQLRESDLCEEPEAAEVDADQRDILALDEMAGGQQRSVSAEHDQGVRAGTDLRCIRNRRRPGPQGRHQRCGVALDQDAPAALAQKLDELGQNGTGLCRGNARSDDHANGLHVSSACVATAIIASQRSAGKLSPLGLMCRKNSRFPVAPAMGDAHAPTTA